MQSGNPPIWWERLPTPAVLLAVIASALASGCLNFGREARAREIARGRILFETHCLGCHGGKIVTLARRPPPLYGIFEHKYLPSGALATDGEVRATIEDGRAGIMPPFRNILSHQDIGDIVAYLHTLKPSNAPDPGRPRAGAGLRSSGPSN